MTMTFASGSRRRHVPDALNVRRAQERDLIQIVAILNREIDDGVAHFGTEHVTIEQARAELVDDRVIILVAQRSAGGDTGRVVGFAKAAPFKRRGAYDWTVEISVYVEPAVHGQGVGKALYRELFVAIEMAGFRTVIATIVLPNAASIRLHEAFGMQPIGLLPRAGFKLGAWQDIGWWVTHLGGGEPPVRH